MMQQGQDVSDVVWIGLPGVGKTALIYQMLGREFDAKYHPTPSAETFLTSALSGYQIKAWDTCGTDSIALINSRLPPKECLLVLVYDISDEFSFQYLEQCLPFLRNLRPMCPAVIVGTKSDISTQSVVSAGSAHRLANEHQCDFVQTSAKAPELFNYLLTTKLQEYREGISTAAIARKRSRCCLNFCLSWIWELVGGKQDGDQREQLNNTRSSTPFMEKVPVAGRYSSEDTSAERFWHIAAGVILSSYEFRNQTYVRVSRPESVVQAVYDAQQKLPWAAEVHTPGVCTVAELWHAATESKLKALSPSDPYTHDAVDALFRASIESLCKNMECITQQVACERPSLHACRIFWQLFVYLQFKPVPLWYEHTQEYVAVARAVPGLEFIELALKSKGTLISLNIPWSHCATIRSYGLSLCAVQHKEFQQLPGWHMVEGRVAGGSASFVSRNTSVGQESIIDMTDPATPAREAHQGTPTAAKGRRPDPPKAIGDVQLQLPTVIKVYTQSIHNDQHWIFAKVRYGNGRDRAQEFGAEEFVTLPGAERTCQPHIWDLIKTRRSMPTTL